VTTAVEAAELAVDFGDPTFVRDPWETLERVRSLGPVVYNPLVNGWMVANYREGARVLGNARSFTTEKLGDTFAGLFGGDTMQFDDTARHDRIKGVWAKQFRRDDLAELTDLIQEVVDQRLTGFVERIRDGEKVDARRHLTRGIPTIVIARMMGLPESDHEEFSDWSDAMGAILGGIVDPSERGREMVRVGREGTASMNAYLREVVEDRGRNPRDDLVGALVASRVAADEMTEAEIVASVTQLVFAGNETTANLMALTLVALAEHPEQRRRLRADRSLVPAAIEEVNRWQTPVALKTRHARGGAAEIAGVPIADDALVITLQIAANRDPLRWERPARFDLGRPPIPHLGFGFGRHLCLGLNLARLEMIVWLNRLLDEVPDWDVFGEIDYGNNFWVRGPKSLMVYGP
jgi:cytochrome P450